MSGPHEVILGIGGYLGHDANAALLVDGRLIGASQEERFTRRKHDGDYPRHAIMDCLAQARLSAQDVTDCVFAEKPLQASLFDRAGMAGGLARWLGRVAPESSSGLYSVPARQMFPGARFHFAWHHMSHVAGAFHTGDGQRAAFLCLDGKGEDYSASAGVIDHGELQLRWEQPYENGLGLLYTLVTYHLGFPSFGSEYKVMGLAPYGRPTLVAGLERLFATDDRGGLRLHAAVKFRWPMLDAAAALVTEATGLPARGREQPLTAEHIDLAASVQHVFEREVFKMARFLRRETGERRLLFCGGCAQNCVVAGRLRDARIFEHVANSPIGGDMGSGLGAALLLARHRTKQGAPLRVDPQGYCLGPEPGPAPAAAAPWRVPCAGSLHDFVAGELAAGRTCGWIRGRMELGARALGARSILADPRQPGMQSRLNLAVKFRESFRPFAPAILAEHTGEWFDSAEASDFMNYTAHLRPELRNPPPARLGSLREQLDFPRCALPSVVHVDFSARLQTVRPSVHPDFHRLLTAFHARTGTPILINTSFNVSGQPIVRTAADAWECFVNTDLDLLVLNDEIYRNPGQRTREEKLTWLKTFAASA